jgi:hypothetical protein
MAQYLHVRTEKGGTMEKWTVELTKAELERIERLSERKLKNPQIHRVLCGLEKSTTTPEGLNRIAKQILSIR